MEFNGLTSASHMSLPEAGYGSEEGQLGSEISGAVSGVTTPGASRLQASQSQERSATMQRLQAASPMEVEGELPDMNAEEMAKEGFYLVKSVLRNRYCQGWGFLSLWEGFGVEEATWEPFSAFVLPEGRLNSLLVDYVSQNNLGELLRLAEMFASKTRARD